MSLHLLSQPFAKILLTRLRDKRTDCGEFRKTLDELSLMLAMEATKFLETYEKQIDTPLEPTSGTFFKGTTVLVPIMRAGSGMLPAFQKVLPESFTWHLTMSRDEKTLQPIFKSSTIPSNRMDETSEPIDVGFVLDPMLATGGSASLAIEMLKKARVTEIVFVGILGAPEGFMHLWREHPEVAVLLAGNDRELNERGFILPGLGDAGDRLFPTH